MNKFAQTALIWMLVISVGLAVADYLASEHPVILGLVILGGAVLAWKRLTRGGKGGRR